MKTIITILLLNLTIGLFGQNPVEYIRSNELEKIKINAADFKKLINSIEYYCDKKTKDSTSISLFPQLTCDITNKTKALTLSSFSQINNWNIGNETYNKITFYYSWPSKAISRVEISFSNFSRSITIKGHDEKKVEALYRDLNEQLDEKKAIFSRIEIGLIISLIMYFLFMFSIYIMPTTFIQIYKGQGNRLKIFISLITFIYIIFYSFYLYSDKSVRDFFPGFELTPDNLSWFDRNANLLGFIGFCITIITIIIGGVKWLLKDRSEK